MANETEGTTEKPTDRAKELEAVHRDVALANTFRLEGIKSSLAVAAALLAFTVSFRPTLHAPKLEWMMLVAWLALGLSVVGALGNLHGWERFYISYRDHDWKQRPDDGVRARLTINKWRRWAARAQWLGLLVGVLFLAFFSWMNFANAVPRSGS